MSARVSVESLRSKIHQLKSLDPEVLDYVVTRWSQGRCVRLSLDKAEPLLIRSNDVKKAVWRALERLERVLKSRYGGVELFSIRSSRRVYGTGKSQLAVFIAEELRKQGTPAEYLTVNVGAVERGEFREELFEVGRRRRVQAIFIDEVDVLISPELGLERQRRILESFANAIIEYSERFSRTGDYRQALVLVLSYKAEEGIYSVAKDRFGRRVLNTLATADIGLTRYDAYEVFRITAALAAIVEGLGDEYLYPLAEFASDFAEYLWSDRDLATLPLGYAISSAVNLSVKFSSLLKELDPRRVLEVLSNKLTLGRRAEEAVREVLTRIFPRLEFRYEVEGVEHGVRCLLDPRAFNVGPYKADVSYVVELGGLEVGRCLVEITAEERISARKREQLETFASQYPTLLLYLYGDEEGLRAARVEVEGLATSYDIALVSMPLHLVKYAAALGDLGGDLCYDIAVEVGLEDGVKGVLHRFSLALVDKWFAERELKRAEEARTKEEATRLAEAGLRRVVRAALKMVDMEGVKTGRYVDVVEARLEKALVSAMPGVDRGVLRRAIADIISGWIREGLGRRVPRKWRGKDREFFEKTNSWNSKKAEEIALLALAPLIAAERDITTYL